MSRVYDSWGRLVGAVLNREELRELALCESFSSSASVDFSSRSSFDYFMEDVPAQPIEFEEIKAATKNFGADLRLGEGAFGLVYKGWIDEHTLTASKPGFGMAIAVKKWNSKGWQGYPEWKNELKYLSKLCHPNLVKLVGYCDKEDNMCLIYEFMPGGSLDNHLFRRGHESLSWATRIKVAINVARGLSFLHDLEKQVIHQGVKSSDILFDGEFNAKFSDMSLARDGPTGDTTHVSTQVMGTYGYAAPEYIATGHLTAKCDVYGFGVVLLELLCGRRVIDKTKVDQERNLVKWAKPFLCNKRKLGRIMDSKLEGQYPHKGACKVATIAFQCLNRQPKQRPRMAEVLVALEQLL